MTAACGLKPSRRYRAYERAAAVARAGGHTSCAPTRLTIIAAAGRNAERGASCIASPAAASRAAATPDNIAGLLSVLSRGSPVSIAPQSAPNEARTSISHAEHSLASLTATYRRNGVVSSSQSNRDPPSELSDMSSTSTVLSPKLVSQISSAFGEWHRIDHLGV